MLEFKLGCYTLGLGQEVLIADPDWRAPILDFIINKFYLKDKEHERLTCRATNYVVIGTELFRHSASSGTLSKCISQQDGVRLLGEIHSGICGNHAGASTLVGKAFRSGFYWPTPKPLSGDTQGASSSQSNNTSRLRPCGQSVHPGHSPVGDSTRWDHSRRLHPHLRRYRQIHQVDRGEAGLIHVSSQGSRVHRRNDAQVWIAQSDHHGLGLFLYRI